MQVRAVALLVLLTIAGTLAAEKKNADLTPLEAAQDAGLALLVQAADVSAAGGLGTCGREATSMAGIGSLSLMCKRLLHAPARSCCTRPCNLQLAGVDLGPDFTGTIFAPTDAAFEFTTIEGLWMNDAGGLMRLVMVRPAYGVYQLSSSCRF